MYPDRSSERRCTDWLKGIDFGILATGESKKMPNLINRYAAGGVLGPVVFTTVALIAAAIRPDYSHKRDFISELGATGVQNAAFMNYAGFVAGGLLTGSLGFALFKILPRTRTSLLIAFLVGMFGAGIALSGIYSCDAGCPQGSGSIANLVHNAIAPIAFLSLIAAALLSGYGWRRFTGLRRLSNFSLLTGVAAMGIFILLVQSLEAREFTGLWQRLLLCVLFSWCIVISLNTGQLARE